MWKPCWPGGALLMFTTAFTRVPSEVNVMVPVAVLGAADAPAAPAAPGTVGASVADALLAPSEFFDGLSSSLQPTVAETRNETKTSEERIVRRESTSGGDHKSLVNFAPTLSPDCKMRAATEIAHRLTAVPLGKDGWAAPESHGSGPLVRVEP